MLTLAFSVLVYYFFSQVTQLSGFGGVNNLDLPSLDRRSRARPGAAVLRRRSSSASSCTCGCATFRARRSGSRCRACATSPRGCARSGSTCGLHRTLAFTFAAFIAAFAGILAVWYNRRISPGSINLGQTIDILMIAVIGGLYRLEGAWVGALTFALLDNYSREWTPEIGNVLGPERFNTLLGVIFLIIVLVSPGGLVGAWERGSTACAGETEEVARQAPRPPRGLREALQRTLSSDGYERREVLRARKLLALGLPRSRWGSSPWAAATTTSDGGDTQRHRNSGGGGSDQGRLSCPTARARSVRSSSRTSPGRTWRSSSTPAAPPPVRSRPTASKVRRSATRRSSRRRRLRGRHGRQGDRGDSPPDGAGGRGHLDRPAVGR